MIRRLRAYGLRCAGWTCRRIAELPAFRCSPGNVATAARIGRVLVLRALERRRRGELPAIRNRKPATAAQLASWERRRARQRSAATSATTERESPRGVGR